MLLAELCAEQGFLIANPDQRPGKVEWDGEQELLPMAERCGNADEIQQQSQVNRVTDDREGATEQIAGFVSVDPEMVRATPFVLIGTPEEIVEDLLQRRERWGFNYVIVGGEDVEPFAPVVAALAGK